MELGIVNTIAQVVAALGVVLTLYYLAAQIRQNTRAVRRTAYQELLNYIANVNLMLADDAELCQLAVRVRSGLDALDEVERMRMLAWFGTVFRHYQNAFALYMENVITEKQWETMSNPLVRHLSTQGGRDMWALIRPSFLPEFQALVDARMAQAGSA